MLFTVSCKKLMLEEVWTSVQEQRVAPMLFTVCCKKLVLEGVWTSVQGAETGCPNVLSSLL